MAATMDKQPMILTALQYSVILLFTRNFLVRGDKLYTLKPSEIEVIQQNSCVFAVSSSADPTTANILLQVKHVFSEDEDKVVFGSVDLDNFVWPNGKSLEFVGPQAVFAEGSPRLVLFKRHKRDRTCLSVSSVVFHPPAELYRGGLELGVLVQYVNSQCGTFRTEAGTLTPAGIHRDYILAELFQPASISDVTVASLHNCSIHGGAARPLGSPESLVCAQGESRGHRTEPSESSHEKYKYTQKANEKLEMARCAEISHLPSEEEFFHEYLKLSKPVIIKNASRSWPAYERWSQGYLREQFGGRGVHVKLTPGGDYEGVEGADLWEDYGTFSIPPAVRNQLQFPDLVTVRPAGVSMPFSEFLDLITEAAGRPERNVSAYLEYSSIPEYFPELEPDLTEFSFAGEKLKRKHLNIWLSDGNTIGRLHFDPYDNLLCQLRGQKEVILFDPHDNTRLYEAHIPQAMLGYNSRTREFRKKTLEDSTSMVMSPVNIRQPDFQRFPRYAETVPMNCTLHEGDVLFMPSFWWHEVYSRPNQQEKRNLAVNYWYEPFLTREFPCPECKLDVNPNYYHLL